MAKNVMSLDRYSHLKRKLPGFGTPEFANAYAEARAFLYVAEGNLLTCAQLTHLGSRLSPLALRIVRWAVTEQETPQQNVEHERRDALLRRTMQESRSADG